jgi:hypothetical protein
MRCAQSLDRLDLQNRTSSPGDVRREGRGKVDRRDERGCERRDGGKRIGTAQRSQPVWAPVQAKAPGGGVAPRRNQVVPIFRDEPNPADRGKDSGQRCVYDVDDPAHGQGKEDGRAQVPLVQPDTQDMDTQTKRMALETEHRHGIAAIRIGCLVERGSGQPSPLPSSGQGSGD